MSESESQTVAGSSEVVVGSPERDIQVKAIVQLEKIGISKNEDDEEEIYKMRAKLYRYFHDEEDGAMWKERGVGDVRILKNSNANSYRLLMRRDQTLKLCLNHYLIPNMEIKPHASSDRALLWNTPADFADGESKPETFCIRFGKPESATEFKSKVEECVASLSNTDSDKLADSLSTLNVKEEKDSNDNTTALKKTPDVKDVNGETKDNKPSET